MSAQPGPWHVAPASDPGFRDIYPQAALGPDGSRWYADCVARDVPAADAALVAAAPDLLRVLRRVADYWAGGDVPEELDREMRELLHRTEGGGR